MSTQESRWGGRGVPGGTSAPFAIPARLKAAHSRTESGRAWLSGIEGQVIRIRNLWDLEIGRPFEDGFQAWCAPVIWKGQGAVLKVTVPGSEDEQADVLERNKGVFLPELLARERGAMLIEKIESVTWSDLTDTEIQEHVPYLFAGLESLSYWGGHTHLSEKLVEITDAIEHGLEEANDVGLHSLYEKWQRFGRARISRARSVALHGDLHIGQIFGLGPVRALDPEPLIGPRAWDAEPLIRRYLDRDDRDGLLAMALVLSRQGVATDDLLYWATMRMFQHWAQSREEPQRQAMWKTRVSRLWDAGPG